MSIGYHIAYLIVIFIAVTTALIYKRMARNANDVTTQSLAHLTDAQSTARAFLDACRLIAIHRNGRMNVFTFARGQATFMIETFGVMSDEPDRWREQAGLILIPPANDNPQG